MYSWKTFAWLWLLQHPIHIILPLLNFLHMKIGLISDTHSYLDPAVFHYFASCDEIWHAGDIGAPKVAQDLASFKSFKAVHGNIDDGVVRKMYPQDLFFDCAGTLVYITHIGGSPPAFNPRVRQILQQRKPDIMVCGHSHILRVVHYGNLFFLNPGAAGIQGIHQVRTLLRFEINAKKLENIEVIELGERFPTNKKG